MNSGTCHVHVVKAMQIAGDASWTESVTLSQVQNLRNDRARRSPRGMKRCAGPIAKTSLTVTLVPRSPFVKGFGERPKRRQVWATPLGMSLACRNSFNRQATTRVCSSCPWALSWIEK